MWSFSGPHYFSGGKWKSGEKKGIAYLRPQHMRSGNKMQPYNIIGGA
jgi:hypothetical protein